MVAGLLGQGLEPFAAACLGVYLHGLAADLAVTETTERALVATDLLDHLGGAFAAADKASHSPDSSRSR
jgi:NAD(P)H-hydrate epimerase